VKVLPVPVVPVPVVPAPVVPVEGMECDSNSMPRILPTRRTSRWTSFVVTATASLWLH
jgi:hypothetical protein